MLQMANLQLSPLNSRIASFNSWIRSEENQRGNVDNCQNTQDKVHVEFDSSTSFLKLARAGFYYTEKKGVKCFQCGVEYNSWGKESPVGVHRVLNPTCPFLDQTNSESDDNTVESLFPRPATTSPVDSRTYNNSCCQPQHTSDDSVTQENCPGIPSNRNLNQRNNGSAPDRNSQRDETPPSRDTGSRVDREQLDNVRRNLFGEADDTETMNQTNLNIRRLISSLSRTNSRQQNEERINNLLERLDLLDPNSRLGMLWRHSDEYTGKIVPPKIENKKLMVRESFRILTFPDPTDQIAEDWARNGFRYREQDGLLHFEEDCVQCVYCGGCASFNENNIEKTHQRISPTGRYLCPMISGIDVGDVTREQEELVRKKLCHKNNIQLSGHNAYPVYHPQYRSVETRMESFQYWSEQHKPTKSQLVAAGFFHTRVANKVVCFCCGVAILNWKRKADSWQQHALVSPTCQFVIHEKGQEFITEMAQIKKLVQLDAPVTEPVSQIGDLVVPDPYPSTLSRDLLTAYTSCGYTTQLLFHLVEKLFYQTCGRYPNISMLKAAVLADGELKKHVDDLDLHKEVIEKNAKQLDQIEHVMTSKDQLTKSTVATINQSYNQQLNNKDMKILEKDHQLHQKDHQLHQKDHQLHQKDHQLHQKDHQLHQKDHQLHQKDHQLHQKDHQLHQKDHQLSKTNRQNLALHCTRQQLRNQLEEKDSIIDEQYGQLEDISSRLQTAVTRHEEREATLVQQRNDYITLAHEIERQKQEIEAEIKKYERELSVLGTECSRLKREGARERQGNGDNRQGNGDNRRSNSDSNRICLFCLDEDRSVMFEPCRHICCCNNCVTNFKNQPCPICRTPIQEWQVVFLN